MTTSEWIFIALFLVFLIDTSHASIRCQGQLIGPGDPEYVLIKECGSPVVEHRVSDGRNGSGDEAYLYYEIDGRTVEVHMIDGHIYEIDGDSKH